MDVPYKVKAQYIKLACLLTSLSKILREFCVVSFGSYLSQISPGVL